MGAFLASMYFGYSYAFFLGSIWVDQGFYNHSMGRPYSGGDIISVFFGVLLGVFALGGLTPNIQHLTKAKIAGKTAFDIIDRVPKIKVDDPNAKEHKLNGEVRFENVDFVYPSRPDQKVLKNFSWTFEAGKTTAVVGASGSGKSTIVQLIERFYDPTAGKIFVDGEELTGLSLRHLRSQIGYVGQEPALFNTSIAENVRLGKPGATAEDIEEALRSTNAWGFVSAQANGVHTEAGAGGSQLSGGEKQRVALSRAFVKKPKLLIFDEATSALDKRNEAEVTKSIEQMKKELGSVTTIVIAHRLSTVVGADTIIVMKKGRIAESGDHKSLLAKGGTYAKLVATQEAVDQEAQRQASVHAAEEAKSTTQPAAAEPVTDQGAPDSARALIPSIADDAKIVGPDAKAADAPPETEHDKYAAKLMAECNEALKELEAEAKALEGKWTLGRAKAAVKKLAGPPGSVALGLVSSAVLGGIMPFLGWLIMKCLFGVAVAQAQGTSGLAEIYPWIICMFSCAALAVPVKAAQQVSLTTVGNSLAAGMRRKLYGAVLHKQMAWHDDKLNAPAIIGNMLNAEVQSLQVVAIDITAASLEGFGGILIGLTMAFVFSWPIACCLIAIAPLMMLSNKVATRVKFKQWGMMASDRAETKEAETVIGDAIGNFKTVASLANHEPLVKKYDSVNGRRCELEAREANCEGI